MQAVEESKPDAADDEFEVEADEAYRNVVKKKTEELDEFDEDEFDDAFKTSFISKEIPLVNKEDKKLGNKEIKTTENLQSRQVILNNQKESTNENKGSRKQIEEPERDQPPLPEFARDLITRKKSLSNKEEQFSPAHSGISCHSSESSERGWSSDPDSFRHKPKKTLNQVKEEWDHVETVTAGEQSAVARSPMVTFTEAIFHFKTANMDEYTASIKPTIKHRGLSAIWHAMTGPPKINSKLKDDRDIIFTLALCPLDNHEAMHIMILQTIYKKLTATNLDCPRYGAHWESIGFQGEDPSTDLRGCGMLGLLTTLNFVSSPATANLAIDVYRLSEDEVQNFPFCVMGINITRIALQIFREEKLNKECNSRNQVFEVFNELYSAIYYSIYRIWKTQHKDISDSGFVIHEVETAAKKNPIQLLKNFQKAMNERKKGKVPTDIGPEIQQGGSNIEKVEKFIGLCDLEDKKEEVHLV